MFLEEDPGNLVKSTKHPNDTEKLKAFGERYSVTTGVELKFDADDTDAVDWSKIIGWGDVNEVAKRYVLKPDEQVSSDA